MDDTASNLDCKLSLGSILTNSFLQNSLSEQINSLVSTLLLNQYLYIRLNVSIDSCLGPYDGKLISVYCIQWGLLSSFSGYQCIKH